MTFENIPLELESYLISIYDSSGELLFESTESKLLESSHFLYKSHYLWDGLSNGIPYYGDFSFDVDMRFKEGIFIKGVDINAVSAACDQISDCMSRSVDCDFSFCRSMSQILNNLSGYDDFSESGSNFLGCN